MYREVSTGPEHRMEYLFTEENLKRILTAPGRPAKKTGDCPICARLSAAPGGADRSEKGPAGIIPGSDSSRLEEFIMVKNSWHILKCPLCSRLYTDEYRDDHLAGGREDEYDIAGIEYAEALELLKGIKAKKLTKNGSTWIVTF
jgi:hypothetical protein